jgi:hypothetical protein
MTSDELFTLVLFSAGTFGVTKLGCVQMDTAHLCLLAEPDSARLALERRLRDICPAWLLWCSVPYNGDEPKGAT